MGDVEVRDDNVEVEGTPAVEEQPWYGGMGYDEDEAEEERSRFAGRLPRRFWLKPSKSAELTFVSDMAFRYREHQVAIKGDFKNWFTCIRNNCPLCEMDNRAYLAYAWFIVDHSKFTDRRGNERKDEVRLFVSKVDTATILNKERERRGGLRGVKLEAYRSSDKVSNVGNSFSFIEKYEPKDLARAKWFPKTERDEEKGVIKGIDFDNLTLEVWAGLLAPKNKDELMKVVSKVRDDHAVAREEAGDEGVVEY